jgi:hypothetical protein
MMRRVARLILATLSAQLPSLCKKSPPRLILKNIAQRLTVSVALAGAAISEPGRTAAPDVRFGSKADIAEREANVRFTSKSGHWLSVS